MTNVASETKLSSIVRSSLHPCLGNWEAIGLPVVYYARAVHLLSAEIKCRHCMFYLQLFEKKNVELWKLFIWKTFVFGSFCLQHAQTIVKAKHSKGLYKIEIYLPLLRYFL